MRKISQQEAIRIFHKRNISLFTVSDAEKIFGIKKQNTLYKLLQRLEEAKIIRRLVKGKYQFLLNEVNDFEIANFLVDPSYVSLESALSFYGILPQFPYIISSVTPARSKKIDRYGKRFEFSHIKRDYFFGFEKKNNFLIATPEKAFLDELYFMSKGLRKVHLEDLDLSQIDLTRFHSMVNKFEFAPLKKLVKELSLP